MDKRNGMVQSLDAFDIWYAEGADHHLFIGIIKNEDGATAFVYTVKRDRGEAQKAFEADGGHVLHITSFGDMLSEMSVVPVNGDGRNPFFQ
jgi:hypothetical protein